MPEYEVDMHAVATVKVIADNKEEAIEKALHGTRRLYDWSIIETPEVRECI